MKKILAGALIGAFIFGVGVTDVNLASATSIPIDKNSDMKNRPEPPKDSDGNILPPPDKNNGDEKNSDMKNRPEPPKDSDGNILPPPDKNNGNEKNSDMKNRPEPPKDSDGKTLPPPDKNDNNKNQNKNK